MANTIKIWKRQIAWIAGIALVRSVYKKEDRNGIKHHRAEFWTNFQKYLKDSYITAWLNLQKMSSSFTYGKHCRCNYVLLRPIKDWEKKWQWLH